MQPHKSKAAVLNIVLETMKDADVPSASGLDNFLTQSLLEVMYQQGQTNDTTAKCKHDHRNIFAKPLITHGFIIQDKCHMSFTDGSAGPSIILF